MKIFKEGSVELTDEVVSTYRSDPEMRRAASLEPTAIAEHSLRKWRAIATEIEAGDGQPAGVKGYSDLAAARSGAVSVYSLASCNSCSLCRAWRVRACGVTSGALRGQKVNDEQWQAYLNEEHGPRKNEESRCYNCPVVRSGNLPCSDEDSAWTWAPSAVEAWAMVEVLEKALAWEEENQR